MLYVMAIIVGTVCTVLSLIYVYEWSGADPYIYVFVSCYTCGICTLMYGLSNICNVIKKE